MMSTPGKRVKIYQISNNVTDDIYIGSTTSALYKRLYRHKYDADKGMASKLCNLMRTLGKDKFKIELIDEGVFPDTDAVHAREMYWIRERRCSLNDAHSETSSDGKSEQTQPEPEEVSKEQHGLNEYMLTIMELQQQVKALQMQVESLQRSDTQAQTEHVSSTHPEEQSDTTPQSFRISDDEAEADVPPDDLPRYDLTDKLFVALRGVVDSEYLEIIRGTYHKLQKINKHMQTNPRDADCKTEMRYLKERLAQRIAIARLDGLDPPSSRLVDTIEKEAGASKNLRKKMVRFGKSLRRHYDD